MRLCFEGERFSLAGGQAVGLRDQRGAQVEVLHGELWITQEGDRRDVILHHGERFKVERGGITVMHALTPAQIRVQERRHRQSRFRAWWRGLGRRLMGDFEQLAEQRASEKSAYRL